MNTINLPLMPQNYYGTFPIVTNLNVGDVLYVGPSRSCEEMTINTIEQDLNNFIITTDKAVLLAEVTTRVNRKG